jgi:hypothetical protein
MSKQFTHNVRVGGAANAVDRLRRDQERSEQDIFDGLKAELAGAFAAPDSAYQPLDADAVIRRSQVNETAVLF